MFNQIEPEEALSEIVAGLVMVLTFTLAADLVSSAGPQQQATIVLAAVGCNIAWGIIDATLYLLGRKTIRSYHARFLRNIQLAPDERAAIAAVRREWDPLLSEAANEADRERLYNAMRRLALNAPPLRMGLGRRDMKGALAIFLLVSATTVPAIAPFLIISNNWVALRISNLLLIAILFLVGFRWAYYIDAQPVLTGLALVAVAGALVGVAIALGG